MPHPFWQALFGASVFVVTAVVLFMASRVAVSAERLAALNQAQLLSHIAADVATGVLASNPGSPRANLAVLVTQQLVAAAGHGVTDARAIERAAVAALVRCGAKA